MCRAARRGDFSHSVLRNALDDFAEVSWKASQKVVLGLDSEHNRTMGSHGILNYEVMEPNSECCGADIRDYDGTAWTPVLCSLGGSRFKAVLFFSLLCWGV